MRQSDHVRDQFRTSFDLRESWLNLPNIEIIEARDLQEFDEIRILIEKLADSIKPDRLHPNFAKSMEEFPQPYITARMPFLLAQHGSASCGCVGLGHLGDGICEMKHLYVKPSYRRHNLGRRLAEGLIERAMALGYKKMRLDTLSEMRSAHRLYTVLGFEHIEPYFESEIEGNLFMELDLERYSRERAMVEIDESWFKKSGGIDRTSAGGVVVRVNAGQLLIAFAKEVGVPRYVLPKGGVEDSESLEDAALREIHEEAGLCQVELIAKLGTLARYDLTKTRWITTHYFLAVTDQIEGVPADRAHHYGLAWAPLDHLPEMFWPEQRELIESNREFIAKTIQERIQK